MMKSAVLGSVLLCSGVNGLTRQELPPIVQAIRELIPTNSRNQLRDFAGGAVRLAAHDAMGSGGADGCVDVTHSENGGIEDLINTLQPTYEEFSDIISRGDFWALASIVAIRATGGPVVPFEWGREDCVRVRSAQGLLPEADPSGNTWNHVKAVFQTRMGFTPREITALMGAHTLGRAQAGNSGFTGSWDRRADAFDNGYYEDMLDDRWNRRTQQGQRVWEDGNRILLDTDVALIVDPDSCNAVGGNNPTRGCSINTETFDIVEEYIASEAAWHRDFAGAYQKLLAVGNDNLVQLTVGNIPVATQPGGGGGGGRRGGKGGRQGGGRRGGKGAPPAADGGDAGANAAGGDAAAPPPRRGGRRGGRPAGRQRRAAAPAVEDTGDAEPEQPAPRQQRRRGGRRGV